MSFVISLDHIVTQRYYFMETENKMVQNPFFLQFLINFLIIGIKIPKNKPGEAYIHHHKRLCIRQLICKFIQFLGIFPA